MPYTCRAVFPTCHTLAEPCSPHATNLQGRVPLMPHTCRTMFPSCHTLAGPCSPHATHLQDHVPPMSHARGGAVLHAIYSQGRVLLYRTHPQGRVSLTPLARRPVSPLIPHSHRDELPSCQNRVKPSFIYSPSGISEGIYILGYDYILVPRLGSLGTRLYAIKRLCHNYAAVS